MSWPAILLSILIFVASFTPVQAKMTAAEIVPIWATKAEECRGNLWSDETARICGERDAYLNVIKMLCDRGDGDEKSCGYAEAD